MEGRKRFRSSSGRSFSGKGKPFRKDRTDKERPARDGDNASKPGWSKSSGKPFAKREKPQRDGERTFSKGPGNRSFSKGAPGRFEKRYSKGPREERAPGGPGRFVKRFSKSAQGERTPGGPGRFEKSYSKGPRDERAPGGPGKSEKRFSKGQRDERSPNRSDKFRSGSSKGGSYSPGGGNSEKRSHTGGLRSERKSFVESRVEKQQGRQDRGKAPQDAPAADGLVRLNKFISNSGVCSRREADDLIIAGLVTVNGQSITELGYKVRLTDDVRYEGKRLKAEMPVYILLNKPKGYITTTDDPQERHTVMHLIMGACKQRVYPVGRLDRNTSGLLLLTNDGDLTEKLTHPSHNVKKIYKAELDKPLTKNDFQRILEGVRLEEGRAIVDDLAIISDDGKTVGLEVHIGWNRLVRRIFESLGYLVTKLDRTAYASLTKKSLERGHWRFLREDEVIRLKHFL